MFKNVKADLYFTGEMSHVSRQPFAMRTQTNDSTKSSQPAQRAPP